MRVLVLQNCEAEGLGLYTTYMQEHRIEFDVVHAYHGEADLENARDYDVLFIGGTPLSIRELDDHAFLRRERACLVEALAAGSACFGICGGGQLLAHALGAEVRRNPEPEIGCYAVRLTDQGGRDPLLRDFPSQFPVFQWHSDTFDVPDGASLLATSDLCRHQVFRRGAAVAVQFHIEVTADDIAQWADQYADELEQVDKDKRIVLEEYGRHEGQMRQLCYLLMDNFFALVR